MLEAILERNYDYAIMAKLDGEAHIARMGVNSEILMADFSLSRNTVHFSFSRKSPCSQLFHNFNSAIDEIQLGDWKINQLLRKARKVYF